MRRKVVKGVRLIASAPPERVFRLSCITLVAVPVFLGVGKLCHVQVPTGATFVLLSASLLTMAWCALSIVVARVLNWQHSKQHDQKITHKYYLRHGAYWTPFLLKPNQPHCAQCLVPMNHTSQVPWLEVWVCGQCQRKIEWDSTLKQCELKDDVSSAAERDQNWGNAEPFSRRMVPNWEQPEPNTRPVLRGRF